MKAIRRVAVLSFVAVVAAGCATTKVTNVQSNVGDERIPKPPHVYVYDFAATAAELPTGSVAAASYATPAKPRTKKEIATAHALSDAVAEELASQIRDLGLNAEVAAVNTPPDVGDLLIRGQFESVEEGSMGKRLVLGFGSGSSDLKTVVQVYLMTATGVRELASGDVDSGSTKGPGLLVPLGIAVATANPIGLVVAGAVKAEGEVSGRTTIEGNGKRTAAEIADRLKVGFEKQGWI